MKRKSLLKYLDFSVIDFIYQTLQDLSDTVRDMFRLKTKFVFISKCYERYVIYDINKVKIIGNFYLEQFFYKKIISNYDVIRVGTERVTWKN